MIPDSPPGLARLFGTLSPWLAQLPGRPDHQALADLIDQARIKTANGHTLRLMPPQDDGLGYEARIAASGTVETRPDNWHDFFNGLVWLAFPRAKATLSGRHQTELSTPHAQRGQARDAMTHFDECGVVVVSHNPEILALIRNFQWKTLFWERRQHLLDSTEFLIFGHGTYEQLVAPFRGLTAKAVLYEVPVTYLQAPLAERLAQIDERLAADLAQGHYSQPRDLHPLPLLGIPGVVPENASADYYDDTWQFRPGRRQGRV